MNLEMVSDRSEQSLEDSVKFSSRLTIRNPVKTPAVIQVSPGVLEDMEVPDVPCDGIRWK